MVRQLSHGAEEISLHVLRGGNRDRAVSRTTSLWV